MQLRGDPLRCVRKHGYLNNIRLGYNNKIISLIACLTIIKNNMDTYEDERPIPHYHGAILREIDIIGPTVI